MAGDRNSHGGFVIGETTAAAPRTRLANRKCCGSGIPPKVPAVEPDRRKRSWSGGRSSAYPLSVRKISPLSWLFIVIGLVLVVVAVIYFVEKADAIPSFFPGHIKPNRFAGRYTKRGIAALVAAIIAFAIAALTLRKD